MCTGDIYSFVTKNFPFHMIKLILFLIHLTDNHIYYNFMYLFPYFSFSGTSVTSVTEPSPTLCQSHEISVSLIYLWETRSIINRDSKRCLFWIFLIFSYFITFLICRTDWFLFCFYSSTLVSYLVRFSDTFVIFLIACDIPSLPSISKKSLFAENLCFLYFWGNRIFLSGLL